MTSNVAGENKGMMDQLKGMGMKILSLPDYPESPGWKKVAHIVADIVVILVGIGVFYMMTRFNLETLADPSLSTLMGMPIAFLICGGGCSWLLQDILGKNLTRKAAKIMACIVPITLGVGAACLVAAGFHAGVTHVSVGGFFYAGLLLLPLSFFFASRAYKIIKHEPLIYVPLKDPAEIELKNSQERNDARKRIDKSHNHAGDMRHQYASDSDGFELSELNSSRGPSIDSLDSDSEDSI